MSDQPLQKAPSGLLELFRLKFGGVGPLKFGEAVFPVVEVGEHYGADILFCAQGDDTAGALPRTSTEIIGGTAGAYAGPIKLHGITAGCTIGAAAGTWAEMHAGITIIEPTGAPAVFVPLTSRSFTPRAANSFFLTAWAPPRPIVIRNGVTFVAQLLGDAGGADHRVSVRWIYEQLGSQAVA